MNKYTDRLDKVEAGHFTGSASYDNKPSGLLRAMAEMVHANPISFGMDHTGPVSERLSKEVNKDSKLQQTILSASQLVR